MSRKVLKCVSYWNLFWGTSASVKSDNAWSTEFVTFLTPEWRLTWQLYHNAGPETLIFTSSEIYFQYALAANP
jgi:hypothetical protein